MPDALQDYDIVILDGACGTELQKRDIPESAWPDREGCNEYLNLTAPELIEDLHTSFLDAGAMVLETNTFGANSIVLAEYGLEKDVAAINAAAVENARRAIGNRTHRFVAGSVGPTTKLASLGQIDIGVLESAYREQMRALIGSGADCLIIETCQDLLQVKTAMIAAFDVQQEMNRDVPVLVSVTIEQTGTMLVGSDIATVCGTLEPFPIFSLGMNCATGPEDMESHIRYLSQNWPGRVSCVPNQGLPEVVDGQTVYRMNPDDYARHLRHFVEALGVSVVGGCCGTSPAHIKRLVEELDGVKPGPREVAP